MGNNKSTISTLNIPAFLGTWWEIASLPNGFSSGCEKISMIYTWNCERKTIDVVNNCYSQGKIIRSHKGVIWIPNPEEPGKLAIQFQGGGPGSSIPEPFWIHYIDYQRFAIIGRAEDNFLWIVSRTPSVSKAEYDFLIEMSKTYGYNPLTIKSYPATIEI